MVKATATVFQLKEIGSPEDAQRHLMNFEVKGDNIMLPIAFRPNGACFGFRFCCCCQCGISIPFDFKAIVEVHGQAVGVWSAGCHFAPPWVSVPFLIPERPFTYYTPVGCLTAENIAVTIVPTLEVRVDTSPGDDHEFQGMFSFAYKLGPQQLSRMLEALLDDTFRSSIKSLQYYETCEFVDGKHETMLQEMLVVLNNSFKDYGIGVAKLSVKKLTFDDSYSVKGRAQSDAMKARKDGNSELISKYQRVLKLIEENEREKRR